MIRLVNSFDFDLMKEMTDALMKESAFSFMFKGYKLTQQMFDSYITNRKEKIAIFVMEDDKEVGFAAFDIIPWLHSDFPLRMARLAYLYVLPEYRNKGYGKEIKEAFEYWGKTAGATHYYTSKKTSGYKKVETVYMKEVQ